MLFSRIALLAAIAVTTSSVHGYGTQCLEHPSCQVRVCEVFDDLCDDGDGYCEQLGAFPWYQCHYGMETGSEPDEFDVKDCVANAMCRSEICEVFDLCDDDEICETTVTSPYFSCHEPEDLDACEAEHPCGEGANCHFLGGEDGVICECDGIVVQQGEACGMDLCATITCGSGADCVTDGYESFCACGSGLLVDAGQDCPGYVSQNPFTNEDAVCDLCEANNLDCDDAELGPGVACFCDGLQVHSTYPCHIDSEDESYEGEENCFTHPCTQDGAACFIEHGLRTCRCDTGDRVEDYEQCGQPHVESGLMFDHTASDDCGGIHICGNGATCHYQEAEGYYCKCGDVLVGHYFDCPE